MTHSWTLEIDGPLGPMLCDCVALSDGADEAMRGVMLPAQVTAPATSFRRSGEDVVGYLIGPDGQPLGPVRLTQSQP